MLSVGLDPSNFVRGQKEVISSLTKTKEAALKTGKDVEKSGEDMSEALSKASRGVLTLMAAFLGGRGLKEFVTDAAKANTSLGNLSAGLGSSPQLISAWGMAAERMGGSAGATQASIQGLSDSLVDLRTQGKQLPDALFQLEAKSGKDIDFLHGWEKLTVGLAEAASTLAKTDPAAADRFLRQLGIDPTTAQLLIQQGPRMAAYIETMKGLAPSQRDLAASRDMTSAWAKLSQEFSQLATKIGTAIAPALEWLADKIGVLVEAMSKWVEAHPKFTEGIVGFLGLLGGAGILAAIKNVWGLRAALLGLAEANAASSSVGLLGLLGRLGIVGAGVAAGAAIMNPGDLNAGEDEIERQKRYGQGGGSGNEALRHRGSGGGKAIGKLAQNENAKAAIDELRKAGYNDNAIAAVVGSMQTESSFNPSITNSSGHHGLWQWDGSKRWPKIAAWIRSQGGDPNDGRWQARAWVAEHNAKPGDAIYDNKNTEAGGAILRNNPNLGAAIHGVQMSERFGVGEEGGRAANAANWLPHLSSAGDAAYLAHRGGVVPMPANMPPKNALWSGSSAAGAALPRAGGAAHVAALSNVANDHRVTTTSSSNEMHVGDIHVNAPGATDAHGIASHIDSALAQKAFARMANYGPY